MSFLSNIFTWSRKRETANKPELIKLREFEVYLDSLLKFDKYVAQSDYRWVLEEYKDLSVKFQNLMEIDMLEEYCKTNNVEQSRIMDFLTNYKDICKVDGAGIIDRHNDEFIDNTLHKEKKYLDNILREVDPQINLDDEQRRVVLSDEDYTLVIAGAGAGKTTTVAAKVKLS